MAQVSRKCACGPWFVQKHFIFWQKLSSRLSGRECVKSRLSMFSTAVRVRHFTVTSNNTSLNYCIRSGGEIHQPSWVYTSDKTQNDKLMKVSIVSNCSRNVTCFMVRWTFPAIRLSPLRFIHIEKLSEQRNSALWNRLGMS